MIYPVKVNIIPVFRHIVEAVRPVAVANFVDLVFEPEAEVLEINCYPAHIVPGVVQLMYRIITFTPPDFEVRLSVSLKNTSEGKKLSIRIVNTGVSLDYVKEAVTGMNQEVEVVSLGNKGTSFGWSFPTEKQMTASAENSFGRTGEGGYMAPVFFQKLRKHMQAYAAGMESLEAAVAREHSERDQVFLKKVNAVILANLDREGFDVTALARGLALSRTQLYRRLKPLTRLSPSQYIRFIRLHKAKEFLESGEMTVGEAAFMTGFIDKSYFTRAFCRQYGFNPSHLRKPRAKNSNHEPGKEKQAVHY